MRPFVLALSLVCSASAQVPIANPGFELGDAGGTPTGWFMPKPGADAGFRAVVTQENCRTGAHCAVLIGIANPPESTFGNLMQTLPATGYTLRRVRLRAAIRVEGANTQAQMWLRLDRADNSMAFLENMGSRPVRSSEWKTYDIETNIPDDAARMAMGVMIFGPGKAWIDDFSLEILDKIRKEPAEPPRPITSRGLINLTAFTRLYGYVRFFHPSDRAAGTDWETFAIAGVRKVEGAPSDADLIVRLRELFQPVAPTVQIWPTGKRLLPQVAAPGPEIVRYQHKGVGLPSSLAPNNNIYSSMRERTPAAGRQMPKPFEAEIVPGITVSVPVALYADSAGTLPHISGDAPNLLYERTAEDRATRLGAVVIAWNVFQHFYPYFDVVKTDWAAELPKALNGAANNTGVNDFEVTLRRLVAALKDGHGSVISPHAMPYAVPPLTLDWVEGQFIVTRVQPGKSEGVAAGDRVLKIDGKPIERAAAEARALISGATEQWIAWRSATELSRCNDTKRMALEIEPYTARGTAKAVEVGCAAPKAKDAESYTEPRPAQVAELEPGIIYVDLDRIQEADWQALIPRLEKAKGIIFDMRGYPGQPGIQALAHLTDSTIRSAKWNVASANLPDRLDSPFTESGWDVQPEKPYFSARRVFLTDGRAISYAETVMGIVERYKLGEIVGGPTAGTNGNVNPFRLPGGYTVSWTGMKVLKHDGSQHHGVGILPTVPVGRTRKGVAEGKDEILLRGLEVLK